jgi:mono/diheme cytochrome c family protein
MKMNLLYAWRDRTGRRMASGSRRTSVVRNLFLLACWTATLPAASNTTTSIDYNRQIRPIFSENCYACHGPDENKRTAGLRLDDKGSALKKLPSGKVAIVPGDPSASELMARINPHNDAQRMPPTFTGKTLSEEQVALVREWIGQGAKWQTHWSYIPPRRPELPEVGESDWVRNEIDRFILARLEREGLQPSPQADKNTLIRRLSFDLVGLPPTPAEVDAFLNDDSPQAYEKLVDRMLASAQYGEKMAQHWLDLARYADSDGHHRDLERKMWPYRDWVIDAFNQNKPLDEFTIEQLAGDLLPNPTLKQRIATGFNRNHTTSTEGGADPEEYITKYVIDRVNTTATVWLGSTLGCAECHDHKYDPFTQKAYYQFYDFFNRLAERGLVADPAPPYIRLPSPEQSAERARLDGEVEYLESERTALLETTNFALDAAQEEWQQRLIEEGTTNSLVISDWFSIGPFVDISSSEAFAKEFPPEHEINLGKSYQNDELFWRQQPSWKDNVIQELVGDNAASYLYRTIQVETPRELTLFVGAEDLSRVTLANINGGEKLWLNGKLILSEEYPGCTPSTSKQIKVNLKQGQNEILLKVINRAERFRFYFSTEMAWNDEATREIKKIFESAPAVWTGEQKKEVKWYFREQRSPEVQQLSRKLKELRENLDELNRAIPAMRVMEDMKDPRPTHVLVRGDYRNRGERVNAGVPAFLPPLPEKEKPNRLTLAKWLVDPNHPLVGRVTVNRFWQLLFGTGLVKTTNEFGSQGELPSHPELLDWLARDFVDNGWDVKATIKKMVLSATYQQSSQVSADLLAKDPQNRLLARGPRQRLPAETIRDNALAISGLLDRNHKTGGPSVFPYQPAGLWEEKAFDCQESYTPSEGADLYRRSLYTFWKRSVPNPMLATFDAPDREVCMVKREITVTPLQAFVTLNEDTYVEAGRNFARRILQEGGESNRDRINYAYKVALARMPDETEADVLLGVYRDTLTIYQQDEEAWTGVATVILNLDETITKE